MQNQQQINQSQQNQINQIYRQRSVPTPNGYNPYFGTVLDPSKEP